MDPVTLITTALTIASPFFLKATEKISEKVGEDVWELIKQPFSSDKDKELITNLETDENMEKVKAALIEKVKSDSEYKSQLQNAVTKIQQGPSQQNIKNEAEIEKQINIQNNDGNIQM